jgi:hypothetical protein
MIAEQRELRRDHDPPTDKATRVAYYGMQLGDELEIIDHSRGLIDPTGFRPRQVTEIERWVGGFRAPQGIDWRFTA